MENDVLGPPFAAETFVLPPDDEGEVVATLVRREGSSDGRCAVLHVHGFSDYFFHRELAERYAAAGLRFYALDLRKCGRSIRPHQTPNFCRDVREYFAELDLAFDRIADDGCDTVILNGHSTGGLTSCLYAHERRPSTLRALVLNSPFLELNTPWLYRVMLTKAVRVVERSLPYVELPMGLSPLYGPSLHREHHGEWGFDTRWKPLAGFPVRVGWLAAVHRAHRQLHAGLDIPVPVLVMHAARSARGRVWTAEHGRADVVLDVEQIRKFAPGLGPEVALVSITGGLHDLFLSAPAVRERVYEHLFRWLAAHGLASAGVPEAGVPEVGGS